MSNKEIVKWLDNRISKLYNEREANDCSTEVKAMKYSYLSGKMALAEELITALENEE